MPFRPGDRVWLRAVPAVDNVPAQPREQAEIIEINGRTMMVYVDNDDPLDDGLRECSTRMIDPNQEDT